MASQINFESINEGYPVAGQDNNSQGFRDNFNLIKLGLETASSEIGTLQENRARVDTDNNFFGNLITNAEIRKLNHSVASLGTITTATLIDTSDADYFYGIVANSVTLTFSNWGADGVARKIYLRLKSDGTSQGLDFASSSPGAVILCNIALPFSTNANSDEYYWFELHTIDGGDTIMVSYTGPFNPAY